MNIEGYINLFSYRFCGVRSIYVYLNNFSIIHCCKIIDTKWLILCIFQWIGHYVIISWVIHKCAFDTNLKSRYTFTSVHLFLHINQCSLNKIINGLRFGNISYVLMFKYLQESKSLFFATTFYTTRKTKTRILHVLNTHV